MAEVKKSIYDKAYEKFEEEHKDKEADIVKLCTPFDIENNQTEKAKSLRAVFKNIKQRIINYIDFDDELMPIPADFNQKMINNKNPHEEIAKDVMNRLNFLFELKPSMQYATNVTKRLALSHKPIPNSGLD